MLDAIVVGSGATGGWAAKTLTEAGHAVVMLESGGPIDTARHYRHHTKPYDLRYGNKFDNEWLNRERQPIQSKVYACDEYGAHFFIDDVDNPYSTPEDRPYVWIRGALLGGRSNIWGRQSLRMSDYEFKAAQQDGYGEAWPISYEDLATFYDEVETFVGISGSREDLPQVPDGLYLPPMPMTNGELALKKRVEARWPERRVMISRSSVITVEHRGRSACHYCGNCARGCRTHSFFSSVGSTIPAALATKRLEIVTDAHVTAVNYDADRGRASGVTYVDKRTGQQVLLEARAVVLAASTIASTRILLNSKSAAFPSGLGNSSGVLGKYLHGHVHSIWVTGVAPGIPKTFRIPEGDRPCQIYIPRFQNLGKKDRPYLRGFGIEGAVRRKMLPSNIGLIPGFGRQFKQAVRNTDAPPIFFLTAFGEMLARPDNMVSLREDLLDRWGVPVPHISCSYGPNEEAMAADILDSLKEIATEAGFQILTERSKPGTPGLCVHEVGTARMGSRRDASVLDAWNRVWDANNVYVVDGACYVSSGVQNPTLTMMAISARASRDLARRLTVGEI